MDKKIYVSTGAFLTRDLRMILKECAENKISNIELGVAVYYDALILSDLSYLVDSGQFNFLVHNYFPPPAPAAALPCLRTITSSS